MVHALLLVIITGVDELQPVLFIYPTYSALPSIYPAYKYNQINTCNTCNTIYTIYVVRD